MATKTLRFYTESRIGPKRSFTPEGFLLCEDVPIARTGTMQYAAGEIPITPSADGFIRIQRDEGDVFDAVAIASFAGKPFTNEHPPEKVTPDNWNGYSKGVVLNPRRGDGVHFDNDYLFADILIQDADTIKAVLGGKREVSAGYDAEYEELGPGEGRQHNIIGNHVASVDRGRCGPRCAVGDNVMAKRGSFSDRVLQAFRTGDENALVKELDKVDNMMGIIVSDEAPGGGGGDTPHHITVNVSAPGRDAIDPGAEDPSVATAVGASGAGGAGGGEEGGEDVMSLLHDISSRLANVENAVAMLCEDEEDEHGEEGAEPGSEGGGEAFTTGGEEGEGGETTGATAGGEEPEEDAWSGDRQSGKRDGYGPRVPSHSRSSGGDRRPAARTGDGARAAVGDSSSMRSRFADTISRAEILAPGIRLPTFDSKKPANYTADMMCSFRRNALAEAWKSADGRDAIEPMLAGRGPVFRDRAFSCDAISAVFNGASEVLRRTSNDRGMIRNSGTSRATANMDVGGAAITPASINEANRKKFGVTR